MVRFSIVVPAYNAEATIVETLDAIVAQTFRDWECVVVDDGSDDSTAAIAAAYSNRDHRFRVLRQKNKGSGGAYNTGVRAAVGQIVVLCSADDILLPSHLRAMAEFIDCEQGYDIYSTNGYLWIPRRSKSLFYGEGCLSDYGPCRDEVVSLCLADIIRHCFYSVGAAYRRELFDHIGGYREDVFGEDYDFWLRAMAAGATHRYLPEPLSLHRASTTQKSASLESVYHSDIRLVTELSHLGTLTAEELDAVSDRVEDAERRLARLARPAMVRDLERHRSSVLRLLLGDKHANRLRLWRRRLAKRMVS